MWTEQVVYNIVHKHYLPSTNTITGHSGSCRQTLDRVLYEITQNVTYSDAQPKRMGITAL